VRAMIRAEHKLAAQKRIGAPLQQPAPPVMAKPAQETAPAG
jgi:hypothetical protein